MLSRNRITQCPVYSWPDLPAICCQPRAPRPRDAGLPQQLAVAVQHRITADDNAIGGDGGVKVVRDRIGLGGGQRRRHIAGRGVGIKPRDDGVLVHTGDDDERIDSRLAQHLTTTR